MDAFTTHEITFRKEGVCGISVRDGILKRYSGLERRDSRPFEGMDVADSCTLRIEVSIHRTRPALRWSHYSVSHSSGRDIRRGINP